MDTNAQRILIANMDTRQHITPVTHNHIGQNATAEAFIAAYPMVEAQQRSNLKQVPNWGSTFTTQIQNNRTNGQEHRNRPYPRLTLRAVLRKIRRKRVPQLSQVSMVECGLVCLAMILCYYGRKTTIAELRVRCSLGRDGLSALNIVKAARSYGMRVRAISLQRNDFQYVTCPAIVHWEFNHFLVVERWTRKFVDVVDPAGGRKRLTSSEFDNGFTGIVIMLEPGVHFERQSLAETRTSLRSYLLQYLRQAPTTLFQVLGASILLQLFGLVLPVLTKFVVDSVLPFKITSVMTLLGVGMAMLVLAQMVTTLLREWLLVYLKARIDIHMMLGFFEHMLTLPYNFFQQRSSGDLLARMGSNTIIRDTLSNQLISTLLDSSMVIIYLGILLWQSLPFALLTLTIGLFQVILLLSTSRSVYTLASRELTAQGRSQGYMSEALISMATLKSAGAEQHALEHWSNLFFDQLNISVRRGYLTSIVGTVMNGLRTLSPLALLWIGALQVLNGSISIGTMLAMNALATVFLSPLASLVSSGQQLQLVHAHLERLSDVTDAQPEQDRFSVYPAPRLTGGIQLENVSFQYDANSPRILSSISIKIEAGKKVAIVGRTGSGKSTLGKLLLGLYLPTDGEIYYDGIPLRCLNYQDVRRQFGVVMQDASIFSGSILHNITLNDPTMAQEKVARAAELAAIHNDIMHMPMGYETMVAEGGSALSGGQRQRLALARAIAHQPVILLLDEATSSLDVTTEHNVEQNLRKIACTQIIIAHRLSTIRNADLILVLDQGTIVEQGTHNELMLHNGYYARLMQSQIGRGKLLRRADV